MALLLTGLIAWLLLVPMAAQQDKRHTIRNGNHDGELGHFLRRCAETAGRAVSNTRPRFCSTSQEREMEMSQTLLSRRVLTPYAAVKDEFINIDCGAAHGWYSLYWSQLGFHTLAFEPGDIGPLTEGIKLNRDAEKLITVHNTGLGKVDAAKGSGTALVKGHQSKVAASVEAFIPANSQVAMMKIDIEGNEMFVLEDILNVTFSRGKNETSLGPPLIHNILVEFTPKWWPGGKQRGAEILEKFVDAGWQFVSSPWSEHAFRVGKEPSGLAPDHVAVDWAEEPLLFAQRIPSADVVKYILSIKFQRDVWIQHPRARFPLDLAKNEVGDILCINADEWRAKENVSRKTLIKFRISLAIRFVEFVRVDDTIPDWKQMLLMSLCDDNIIANSTFSWWSAFLNLSPAKRVFYPATWFGEHGPRVQLVDFFPVSWVRLE